MSRVTKLQKQNRRQQRAKDERWRRNHAKSIRVWKEQGGRWDWETPERPDTRVRRAKKRCACGHRLSEHGHYGCRHGCAWGTCEVVAVFVGDTHAGCDDFADAMRYSVQANVLLGGDMMHGDLKPLARKFFTRNT